MENAQRYRAIALICRQQAGLHPEQNWEWLAQAERWEHLAEANFVPKGDERRQPANKASVRPQMRNMG